MKSLSTGTKLPSLSLIIKVGIASLFILLALMAGITYMLYGAIHEKRCIVDSDIFTIMLFLMIAVVCLDSEASESNHITIGLYTEHYQNDSDELNENNELVQYSHVTDTGVVLTASTFLNSHGVRTYTAGVGYARDNMGVTISAVHGYDNYLRQHYKDILFAPTAYYLYPITDNHGIKVNLVPTVVNIGYDYKF